MHSVSMRRNVAHLRSLLKRAVSKNSNLSSWLSASVGTVANVNGSFAQLVATMSDW